ncbi:cupin domain-containing protein [Parasphingopyxis sp. CP4]|uniref:cupin domain-containing protein n=1 Tax=Parasphingopyxis sp. CP4 TaxID=2724527 RepID=UPI00159FE826|nr:cupin domain-containing protein [Parasphingopyxis sp. CP4]QLC21182.1 cupin domain-containing protein [Parasphingopyxis sp. CP4]
MQFRDFDPGAFLSDYWQKKPLLIRNPWDAWVNPVDPDTIAGLACEDEVEARLITQNGTSWAAEHGPFPESRFANLSPNRWSLLVQAVDHFVPEVAGLMAPFRFIPNWRIDDVMVSIAADQGGVGPHFDQYDVFLIQGHGRRKWQIGGRCDEASTLRPHDDLRLLEDFAAEEEWILEPGDILYIPPGIAHNGIAVGDNCMTYSIGFRAPSRSELIAHWADSILDELDDDDRYADPDLREQENPGEIDPAAIDRLHAMVTERLADRAAFTRWFGEFSSASKYPEIDWRSDAPIREDEVRSSLAAGLPLQRNSASRFTFVREEKDAIRLFVDGVGFGCHGTTADIAMRLCAVDILQLEPGSDNISDTVELITQLINQGSLSFNPDPSE